MDRIYAITGIILFLAADTLADLLADWIEALIQ